MYGLCGQSGLFRLSCGGKESYSGITKAREKYGFTFQRRNKHTSEPLNPPGRKWKYTYG